MRSRSVLLPAAALVLLASCRAPSEIRPAFAHESRARAGTLSGTVFFTSRSADAYVLYTVDASAGGAQRVTIPGAQEKSASFSPDRTKVAFAGGDTRKGGIYVRPPGGGDRRAVVEGEGLFDSPTWSPDGKRIAYAFTAGTQESWDVWVVNVDGTDNKRVTDEPSQDWAPAWSPRSAQIAFTSDRAGDVAIWIVDTEDGRQRKVVDSAGADESPAWAPDGARFAFSSNRELKRWQLFTFDPATLVQRRLVRSDSMDRYPAWSPDGAFVLVSVGYPAVYRADGKKFPGGADRWKLSSLLSFQAAWGG